MNGSGGDSSSMSSASVCGFPDVKIRNKTEIDRIECTFGRIKLYSFNLSRIQFSETEINLLHFNTKIVGILICF